MRYLPVLVALSLFAVSTQFAAAQGFGLPLPSDVLRTPLEQPEWSEYASEQGPPKVHLLLRRFRPGRRLIERPSLAKISFSNEPRIVLALPQHSHVRRTTRRHRRKY